MTNEEPTRAIIGRIFFELASLMLIAVGAYGLWDWPGLCLAMGIMGWLVFTGFTIEKGRRT
jgi:hypothetical protein